ncbi:amphi-Trp domain-containing protein [Nocardia cyriacigeorgica]|uniref:Amphi-Trp domain-containing protein n=1 Tax=Nocardia cyriacigeorgica TaxID=135487 RepID=A0A6P1DC51_9NOCA|nr:amphi-Trp domain-containing protein [Nocardia cyriacigeorgica]NEW39848.1 amphi-Trp domain-containing protein [Nocardia cyriacigeorgica]NEW47171.1 amphi-Trp domain-containing protein [Nocardia cyriacigeorgica]NEW51333.1 amphi-Trp domain-containing protein [Nocardia cyriacigeorgica]NEW55448.1 amphi-Trp domain-containing protein [Nocardia cyriacigeorgica]
MPKLELKKKSALSRDEVSQRLIALGQALAGGSEVELGSEGESLSIEVADQVRWELEIEVDGDETEIEIEISWRDDTSGSTTSTESKTAVRARPARRARPRKTPAK